jgi:hypothetical protein
MKERHTFSIAKEFSPYPAGRYKTDGPFSGENFREILVQLLKKHDHITIDLDGSKGFGSSFLEESFGGLVRHGYFSAEDLRNKISINSKIEAYINDIWDYIEEAEKNK